MKRHKKPCAHAIQVQLAPKYSSCKRSRMNRAGFTDLAIAASSDLGGVIGPRELRVLVFIS